MSDELKELKDELEPYKNTLVIDGFDKVARLVDVVDGGYDYLWVYDSKSKHYMHSCLINWIPLKGFLRDDDYNNLLRIWNLNNIEKAI